MNIGKVPIIVPKRQVRPSKIERKPENAFPSGQLVGKNLLKDDPDLPQITLTVKKPSSSRVERTKLPPPRARLFSAQNNISNDLLSEPDRHSEPEYPPRTHRIRPSQGQFDQLRSIANGENDDLMDLVYIQGMQPDDSQRASNSARDLPRAYELPETRKSKSINPKTKNDAFGEVNVKMPSDDSSPTRSPRSKPKLPSVREGIEESLGEKRDIKHPPFDEIIWRKDVLVGIARYFYPETTTDEDAIINLIELNKDFAELYSVIQDYHVAEKRNKEILLAPITRLKCNPFQLRDAKHYVSELCKARKKLAKLRGISSTTQRMATTGKSKTYDFVEDLGKEKIDQQVSFTKMKNNVQLMKNEVERLEKELATVEKRIKLMTQGKSLYAGLHPERIRDMYGKLANDIPMLGEDPEDDSIDYGIFTCTYSVIHDEEEAENENPTEPDDNTEQQTEK